MNYPPPEYLSPRIVRLEQQIKDDEALLRQLHESLKEQREAYNLYTTVSIEMRTKDEALLRRALTYLEYASQQLPMIHASIVDPVIDELKERLL